MINKRYMCSLVAGELVSINGKESMEINGKDQQAQKF